MARSASLILFLAFVTVSDVYGYQPQLTGFDSLLVHCCTVGSTWGSNHTTCTGPQSPVPGIPPNDRMACSTAIYICCIRFHRVANCERGKQAARTGQTCIELPHPGGETYKDCCDGCSLGLKAGSLRMICSSSNFNFGTPWDEAYEDCCVNSVLNPGTSSLTEGRCRAENPCGHICEEKGTQIQCSCYPGYVLSSDHRTCEDINECELQRDTCNHATETCVNTPGSFQCVEKGSSSNLPIPGSCPTGYEKNPTTQTCDDVDECILGGCKTDTEVCINTIGSFTCSPSNTAKCRPGFRLQQNTGRCIDVDECAEGRHTCDPEEELCLNSYGAYQCRPKTVQGKNCPAGFKWSETQGICEDVNECTEEIYNCDDQDEECRNTVGGYECDPRCARGMRFDEYHRQCTDIDECLETLHDCRQGETCVNTAPGYRCLSNITSHCPPGYKPTPPIDGTPPSCVDVDECSEGLAACNEASESCVNAIGSYSCVSKHPDEQQAPCPPGYRLNQDFCEDINECEEPNRCLPDQEQCVNLPGGFRCQQLITKCSQGYRYNASTKQCDDIDECSTNRHNCIKDSEICVNVNGGFRCYSKPSCVPGFTFSVEENACVDVDECTEGSDNCNRNTQDCVNEEGSYKCLPKIINCPRGYESHPISGSCDDINECDRQTDDCDRIRQYCVNSPGSYQCHTKSSPRVPRCGIGYRMDVSTGVCKDINECDEIRPCLPDQTCENSQGSYKCLCQQGFTMDHVSRTCRDINECQLDLHSCVGSQRCDNTIGSFTCVRTTSCGTGYTLNAGTNQCEDDDECILGSHNCGPGFACRNTLGSFRCDRVRCPTGQRLLSDGSCQVVTCGKGTELDPSGNCIDVNECLVSNPCRANQRCINTVGSYRCQNLLNCGTGYELNEQGNKCVDIDECTLRTHDCLSQQICRNRPGGYTCECPPGHSLNAQRICEDIDECTRFRGQICSASSECQNTPGSYICNCKEGFKKAEDGRNCVDIDECAESPNICHQNCFNIWGSYKCTCKQGYTVSADGRNCQDIDECSLFEGRGNLCIGFCVNEPGSYSCSCPDGYRLSSDKRTCQDIDECQEQNLCKGENQVCLNTRGSYKCNHITCPPNYERDRDHRNVPGSDDTVLCRKKCKSNDIQCILNDTQTITYQGLALPTVHWLRNPLILTTMRAVMPERSNHFTDYEILDGNADRTFDVLKGDGVGSLRLVKPVSGPIERPLKILMTIHLRYSNRPNIRSLSRHLAVIQVIVSPYDF